MKILKSLILCCSLFFSSNSYCMLVDDDIKNQIQSKLYPMLIGHVPAFTQEIINQVLQFLKVGTDELSSGAIARFIAGSMEMCISYVLQGDTVNVQSISYHPGSGAVYLNQISSLEATELRE